ncbi:MAG: hypothetical protein IJ399_03645 [Bacilli bacterium]|nr:hypothetical protein [Bacilli bacterium]
MNNSFNDIFNTNPRYSTSLAFILGLILVDNLNSAEQNTIGNWIILLGQTILTNAASQNIIESRILGTRININSKEVKSIYNPFYYDINKAKDIINKLYPNNKSDLDLILKSIDELRTKIEQIKKD